MRARGGQGGGGAQNRQLNCRGRSRLSCRPQPSQELPGKSRGPKPVAKPPGAVPSGNRNPASPTRTTGKGSTFASPPRPSATGTSTLLPTAPVEPPVTAVVADRITHTTAFVTPVVEHWLEREIAQWVHPMKDRSDDPSHHERTDCR